MIIDTLLLIFGFIILIKGADLFVDGSSSIATNFKVSKILIGLTIVAFGTSAPEFAVSIKSIISNNHDIVLGNVIGSNIMNILLILGICSLFKPLLVNNNTVRKEIPILLLFTLLFSVLLSDNIFDNSFINAFTRSDGVILGLFFAIFVYYLISIARNRKGDDENIKMSLPKSFLFTIIGIVMIVLGSNYVVNSASSIATTIGVSEKLIGLTIIAFGTSLPELVTSIVATKKGECDLAIGNIVGSNIFNIGIVMGIPTAIFGGISKINFNYIDIITMIICVILLFIFSYNDRKISRKEGIIFLLVFIVYYSIVVMGG